MMWSLILVVFVPLEPPLFLGELGKYTEFNQCVFFQNIGQSQVVAQDPTGLLFCVKDFDNTNGIEQ